MDSCGVRHAHRAGILPLLSFDQRLVFSPLTWLPTPGGHLPSALRPEIRFPDPGRRPPATPSAFGPAPHPAVEMCETLETLHGQGAIVIAETDACTPSRVIEIEQAWKSAGGLARLMDESISAVLVAEVGELPLVSADVSVLRVARHRGLVAVTVEEFAANLAA